MLLLTYSSHVIVFFLQRTKQSILDVLTPDDIRMLIETEDEVHFYFNFLNNLFVTVQMAW